MIRGYVEQPSPCPGGSLTLRVSTDAPQFRVEFYRCGDGLARCGGSGWLPGEDVPSRSVKNRYRSRWAKAPIHTSGMCTSWPRTSQVR
jgi:hypothetical protein